MICRSSASRLVPMMMASSSSRAGETSIREVRSPEASRTMPSSSWESRGSSSANIASPPPRLVDLGVVGAKGKADRHRGPGTQGGGHIDAAAVAVHDVLGDGQAQARARDGPAHGVGGPVEAGEHMVDLVAGNADAGIGDPDGG